MAQQSQDARKEKTVSGWCRFSARSTDLPFAYPHVAHMLIKKYILLNHVYEIDTRNNFMWITNCKTWRDYCLIICHLSTFLFWYTIWDFLPVIPGM